jgi:diguanylate cyclase (GGDEF)-like protein/hemerythrin-like metal-binding protein
VDAFIWNDVYVTGIPEVDRQHRHLVEVINRFGEVLTRGTEATEEEVSAVFEELKVYAEQHFREEEAIMGLAGVDPRYVQQHHREHQGFLDEVLRMRADKATKDPSSFLLQFLSHWLAYHILGSDHGMARQVAAIAAGESAESAWRTVATQRDPATASLLTALDGLFRQVSERDRELYQLNRNLEARVAERTHELLVANQRLEDMAMTDALTGLPNRRKALRCFDEEWRALSVRGLSCMMIDADGFKTVNDTFGHDAGDDVLRALSRCLRGAVRTDDYVCRLGGDEFLIICPHTSLAGALQLAETVRQKVAAMVVPTGAGQWKGSVSVGVAARAPDTDGVDGMMRLADEGLYLAKRGGRNAVATVCASSTG